MSALRIVATATPDSRRKEGGSLLGCTGYHSLQSLNLSLDLHRVIMPILLLPKAPILNAVRVVEKQAGFFVLLKGQAAV